MNANLGKGQWDRKLPNVPILVPVLFLHWGWMQARTGFKEEKKLILYIEGCVCVCKTVRVTLCMLGTIKEAMILS